MRAEQAARPDKARSPFDALLAASGEAGAGARAGADRCRPAEGVGTSDQGDKSGDTATSSGVSENIRGEGYAREECSEVHDDTPRAGSGAADAGSGQRRGTKRARMVWTGELHERFLNAVNHLGMKNAVPKTILRMMNVDGMTRENVASHLQKYRLHLKRQATGQGEAPAAAAAAPAVEPATAPAATAAQTTAAPVTGVPLQLLPAAARSGTALGVPVCGGVAGLPASMAHIPHQAWSAGVPGYDALQVLQSLSAAAAAGAAGGSGAQTLPAAALAASLAFPLLQPVATAVSAPPLQPAPVLDIAPLSTAPPASSAATG